MRFRFNEKKAAQAAAHLLKLSNGKLNYMMLIKLLFLADREALAHHGVPITGARIVGMKHGPVPSQILDLINEGEKNGGPWTAYVSPPSGYDVQLNIADPEDGELSRYELRVLSTIHARFAKMDKWDLVEWLHKNIPEWKDPGDSMLPIEFEDILRARKISEEEIKTIQEDADYAMALGSLGR